MECWKQHKKGEMGKSKIDKIIDVIKIWKGSFTTWKTHGREAEKELTLLKNSYPNKFSHRQNTTVRAIYKRRIQMVCSVVGEEDRVSAL